MGRLEGVNSEVKEGVKKRGMAYSEAAAPLDAKSSEAVHGHKYFDGKLEKNRINLNTDIVP